MVITGGLRGPLLRSGQRRIFISEIGISHPAIADCDRCGILATNRFEKARITGQPMRWDHIRFVIAIGVPSIILYHIFPIASHQELLWITTFLFFVVGDSATTSLIQRYENLEEVGPATREICGSNPSIACSFRTRILVFCTPLNPLYRGSEIRNRS